MKSHRIQHLHATNRKLDDQENQRQHMSIVYERILPVSIPGARHIDRMHATAPIVANVHPLVDVLIIALVGQVAGPLRKLISQEVW